MNAKERQKMRRLEIENAELRERLEKSMVIYRDQSFELIELRTALHVIREAAGMEVEE